MTIGAVVALGGAGALALVFLAAFVLLRERAHTHAEAMSIGIVASMALLSLDYQLGFLIGWPPLSWAIEALLLVSSGVIVVRRRHLLGEAARRVRELGANHRAVASCLAIVWVYMFAQVILLPPGDVDSLTSSLARVLLFQQEQSLLLDRVTSYTQAAQPVGGDLLAHSFLRFHVDSGIAIFSFSSYLAIGLGTYALGRRHASEEASLAAALVALSLPMLALQATSTKPDVLAAAAAVACLVSAFRGIEDGDHLSLALVPSLLSYGVGTRVTSLMFALPFGTVFIATMVRRSGVREQWTAVRNNLPCALAICLGCVLLSGSWLFLHNHARWGGWAGPPAWALQFQNQDGVPGAIANTIRYGLQSVHLLPPIDRLCEVGLATRPSELLQRLYEGLIRPSFGEAGILRGQSFAQRWSLDDTTCWFGPLAAMFIPAGLILALARGTVHLRLTVLALAAYPLGLSWQLAWMPWNVRFFSLFFACTAFLSAAVIELPPARHRRRFASALGGVACAILVYSTIYNTDKPLLRSYGPQHWLSHDLDHSIWARTDFGRDRAHFARKYGWNAQVSALVERVEPGDRVALVADFGAQIHHHLLSRPDVRFVPILCIRGLGETPEERGEGADVLSYDAVLVVRRDLAEVETALGLSPGQPWLRLEGVGDVPAALLLFEGRGR